MSSPHPGGVGVFKVHVLITETGSSAFEAYVDGLDATVSHVRGAGDEGDAVVLRGKPRNL